MSSDWLMKVIKAETARAPGTRRRRFGSFCADLRELANEILAAATAQDSAVETTAPLAPIAAPKRRSEPGAGSTEGIDARAGSASRCHWHIRQAHQGQAGRIRPGWDGGDCRSMPLEERGNPCDRRATEEARWNNVPAEIRRATVRCSSG